MNTVTRSRLMLAGGATLLVVAVAALWSARDHFAAPDPASRPESGAVGADLSPKQIASRAMRATLQISALDAFGRVRGDGTGFFVSSDGLIATNLHVIRGAYSLEIETLYGLTFDSVYFIAADSRRDLALLKVKPDSVVQALALAAGADPEIGERVYVTGNPLGQTGTFSDGLVSARRGVEGTTFIQISAPVSPGSSGGPVMNTRGEVLGVTTLRLQRGLNLNYAIPVRYLRRMMDSVPAAARYARGLLPQLNRPSLTVTGVSQSGHGHDDTTSLDVIARQVRRSDSVVKEIGGAPDGAIVRGRLAHADSSTHELTLQGGREYVVTGHCDEHCAVLNLSALGKDDKLLDADIDVDDAPKLRFVAPTSGRYQLRVGMADCDVKACVFGFRVYHVGSRRIPGT